MFSAFAFLRNAYRNRRTIRILAGAEVQQRYVGTAAGVFWLFFPPIASMAIYWFVFSVGFRVSSVTGRPFALWLVAGLMPWLLISDCLTASLSSVTRSPHLVKRILFPTETLPLVQLAASAFVHSITLLPLIIAAILVDGRIPPQLIQIPYYLIATMTLAAGWAWLLAALNPLLRDIAPAVTVGLNLWFWLTPIAWPEDILPPYLRQWLWLNPVHYLVEGYRDALLGRGWFWEKPTELLSFWIIALLALALGAAAFQRLKPEFAEVL